MDFEDRRSPEDRQMETGAKVAGIGVLIVLILVSLPALFRYLAS